MAFLLVFFLLSYAATEEYKVDPAHTSVSFKIKHLAVTNVHGRFNDVSGRLRYDPDSSGNSAIEIKVNAASVDTAVSKRDEHLRSSDFFDVKKFPYIEFKSTSVKKVDAENYEVSGNLTLHGVTRPLKVSVVKTGEGQDPWGGYRVGFETEFTIRRSDFGMKTMLVNVGNKVRISVSVEAVRK
jgi:polyisoprenoid-binding protein YceI